MRFRALKYFAAMLVPVLGFQGLTAYGAWAWFPLAFAFGVIPALEFFTPTSTANLQKAEEEIARRDRLYDWLLYLVVPSLWALLVYFLWGIQHHTLTPWEIAGRTLGMGFGCGVLGINVAHELGHRHKAYERILAKLLLLSSLYMHFYIEHNKGHHRWVSTDHDPASARRGESLYAFWVRSTVMGWFSAWRIEAARLRKAGKPRWNPLHNEMLRFQLIQLAVVVAVYFIFGPLAMGCFVAAALFGALLLETVNYIEHYGLRRHKLEGAATDAYERTLPVHSWNSNHALGRVFLFELTRHSDHHYMPQRPYQILRHHDDAPQMPFGYPAMMVLALVPPLWFWIMHRQIDRLRRENVHAAALA
jgi:alkane 1-monooxygenase